jgi:hypothetical protein
MKYLIALNFIFLVGVSLEPMWNTNSQTPTERELKIQKCFADAPSWNGRRYNEWLDRCVAAGVK